MGGAAEAGGVGAKGHQPKGSGQPAARLHAMSAERPESLRLAELRSAGWRYLPGAGRGLNRRLRRPQKSEQQTGQAGP